MKKTNAFFWFLTGGLVGIGLALCYAPSSGEEVRSYLELKSEIARARAAEWAERKRGSVNVFFSGIKATPSINPRIYSSSYPIS